jgi:hypothetical protein
MSATFLEVLGSDELRGKIPHSLKDLPRIGECETFGRYDLLYESQ